MEFNLKDNSIFTIPIFIIVYPTPALKQDSA